MSHTNIVNYYVDKIKQSYAFNMLFRVNIKICGGGQCQPLWALSR